MRAALYARISTLDKGQDPDLQLRELRAYAAQRGWETVEFIEQGVSGGKTKRPALDDLMKAAKARKIDAVVVWRMDRLGRSLQHLLSLLADFDALGVAFVTLREGIDMTTPTGRLMAHMIGAFAEFERERIRERVKAGVANAKAKGKRIGRRATDEKTLRRIIELHQDQEQKLSLRVIAKKTDVSLGTVQRTIEAYKQGLLDRDGLKTIPLFPEVFAAK